MYIAHPFSSPVREVVPTIKVIEHVIRPYGDKVVLLLTRLLQSSAIGKYDYTGQYMCPISHSISYIYSSDGEILPVGKYL